MVGTQPASQGFVLFEFIVNQPPGVGFSMEQMKSAVDTGSDQTVRQLLVVIRKGEVPNPAAPAEHLRALPVYYDFTTSVYFNFETTTDENVEQGVSSSILFNRLADLLTRARSLRLATGDDGFGKAIADQILSDAGARQLLGQIPILHLQQARHTLDAVLDARWLIAIADRNLPPGEPSSLGSGSDEADPE